MEKENIFDEKSLREDIIKTWGPAGAHIDVFDRLCKRTNSKPTLDQVKKLLSDEYEFDFESDWWTDGLLEIVENIHEATCSLSTPIKEEVQPVGEAGFKEKYIDLIRHINVMTRGMCEYFAQSNYREMYGLWNSLIDFTTQQNPLSPNNSTSVVDQTITLGKQMKVLDWSEFMACVQYVPFSMLSNEWAIKIHNQTLDKLNSRGGMSVAELVCNIKQVQYTEINSDENNQHLADELTLLVNHFIYNANLTVTKEKDSKGEVNELVEALEGAIKIIKATKDGKLYSNYYNKYEELLTKLNK